jgi:alpha-amylase
VENLPQDTSDGEGYHGYWAQNIYSLNSNFGTAADLVALSAVLHARGMVRSDPISKRERN